MARITIKGEGSIPEKEQTFDAPAATAEGHKQLFDDVRTFIDEYEAETADADAAAAKTAAASDTPSAAGT